ncbi:MAG: hypothetical protein RI953_1550, partial [Pseudomonadota bacterium]
DANNNLMLVDEIHTPDASRFVDLKQFEAGQIEHLSKEWLREIVQAEKTNFERSAATEQERQMPFVLRPFWNYDSFKLKLANGLAHQYHALFERLFPQLTPWDIISPHLVPWPVDPSTMRTAENLQRLPSNVLVVGSGGRDYTIASFVERAAEVDVVYCWPGRDSWTGGKKASLGKISSDELVRFCKEKNIGWAVFGPEIPIAQGIAEKLRASGIPCLAPDLDGAMLESSKIHTKDVLKRSGCPTAESWTLGWSELKTLAANSNNGSKSQRSILDEYPYVLKYESLAAGKGVCLVFNPQERAEAIAHFEKNLPEWTRDLAGIAVETYTRRKGEPQFLVEKLLPGKEISAIALCHGEDFKLLPYAQDYKRRNNGQTGPNTGGMGAVCPVALDPALDSQIHSIFSKTLRTLKNDGQPYRGFLFAGLMVDDNNVAQVLEFNCRLGDPETQVILPGLGRDLLLSMWLASKNESWGLNPWTVPGQETSVKHDGLNRCFVVVSSPEYPDSAAPARILSVLDSLTPGCEWIPAGTDAGNKTSAGRIGGILAAATDRQRAVQEAYAQTEKITFISTEKSRPHYRTDITFPDMKSEQESR